MAKFLPDSIHGLGLDLVLVFSLLEVAELPLQVLPYLPPQSILSMLICLLPCELNLRRELVLEVPLHCTELFIIFHFLLTLLEGQLLMSSLELCLQGSYLVLIVAILCDLERVDAVC